MVLEFPIHRETKFNLRLTIKSRKQQETEMTDPKLQPNLLEINKNLKNKMIKNALSKMRKFEDKLIVKSYEELFKGINK